MGILTVSKEDLEEILESNKLEEICDTTELKSGDRVLMSVGTFGSKYCTDDNWRWVTGYVKKAIPASRTLPGKYRGDQDYQIIKISPIENERLRKLLPALLTVDVSQRKGVCYGRILKYV